MKKYLFIFIIPLLMISSCQKGWYVLDDQAGEKVKQNALPYYLPRTQVHIKIKIDQYRFVPGPYAGFAKSYLTLENIEMKERYFWAIQDVEFKTRHLPDPEHKYWIVPEKITPDLSLSQGGVLSGINTMETAEPDVPEPVFFNQHADNPANLDFTNMQIDKSKYEVIDTTYRIVEKDSVVQRIPVYQTKEKEKDMSQKAKDAADFIIRVRKNKFSLEAAIEDQQVSGVDIKYMIDKLEETEQSYLELFTGKLQKETVDLYYTITPESESGAQNFILDYIDKEMALPVDDQVNSEKISFMVLPLNEKYARVQPDEENKSALVYRQPMPVQYILYLNDEKIFSKPDVCPQMGNINDIPANLINNESQIKLNSETGEILHVK
ncbi:MAG: DUF4831 family protein [Bacteroidales bacterium]